MKRQLSDGVAAMDREVDTTVEPADLEPPDSDLPDPARPGFASKGRRPSYAFTLAASRWYTEHYPEKAANLWDALHVDRSAQPDRLADREAGE